MDRIELKNDAKAQIKGNIGMLFCIGLVITALAALCGIIPGVGVLVACLIVGPATDLSLTLIFLNLAKGQKPQLNDTFLGFQNFWPAFKVSFLTDLYTFLWSLLFIIPGIIKSFSYSMAMYVLAENPEISATEAINRSKEMMEGHKMDLFVLILSFIGWSLLGTITFGIAFIWVIPYISATATNFYNKIKPTDVVNTPSTLDI